MTRMVYTAGVCAILAAGVVLVSCVRQWRAIDSDVAVVLAKPSAMEVFRGRMRQREEPTNGQVSSLVVQAQSLAAILNPPKPLALPEPVSPVLPEGREMVKKMPPLVRREQGKASSVIQPKSSSLKFSVLATSYYAAEPGKSMALVAEPGGKAGSERWVREGHKLGHFVVHEIRQGAVVFRQGQDLKEVAVDQAQGFKGLVTAVHSPPMREVGDTNTEKQHPERNRKDRDKDNPLDEEAVVMSRASGS